VTVEHASADPGGYVPIEDGFDGIYGLEIARTGLGEDGVVRGRVRVGPELLGAEGRLHGGVPAAIAESLASHGTGFATAHRGTIVSGLSNDTTVTAPVAAGQTLHAEATPHSRADDHWVWTVQLRDDAGTLCAFSRVTIAVRPARR
jgi:1,4-dihydroxy-2-naphthoyl-CoA hydrolase